MARGYMYQNDRQDYKKKKHSIHPDFVNGGIRELRNQTEQTQKSFFVDFIMNWYEQANIPPQQGYQQTPTGPTIYYVLCELPYKCFAVYSAGKIHVAQARYGDGTLDLLPYVEYDINKRQKIFGHTRNVWEDEFVRGIAEFVRICFPH
jgi:hypothetical protein